MMHEYESFRRVVYGEGATFVPICRKCGRFAKADPEIVFNGAGQPKEPNCTCSKCGRSSMIFEGYI